MRLIPGTKITVKIDDEERRFTLVLEDGDGNGRLNVKAPLAVLLGAMRPGDVAGSWTPSIKGAVQMRVELTAVEVAQNE